MRRALGHRLDGPARLLGQFVCFMEETGASTVTSQVALDWATGGDPTPGVVAVRLSAVRHFASYLRCFDDDTEVPDKRLMPGPAARTPPYVFSAAETAALMAAAHRLRPALRGASFETLIGLMAATGLRTSEALHLERADVTLDDAMLHVRWSKFGKSRLVPLHETTTEALKQYVRRRDRWSPSPAEPSFFVAADAGPLGEWSVIATFRGLLDACGISAAPGKRRPRLHDLRPSFAVATLLDWHAEGADVQAQLPVLSTYLGHVAPSSTYWYLEATPELMAVTAARLERHLEKRP
jgi:integrase